MKLLIFDYFRRKWWIMAAGAAMELVLGWTTALSSGSDQLESGTRRMISVFQFQIALFLGVLLLSFDLQRGLARVVSVLPVSARQAGRAWWLSSVGLPAVALAVPLFLGAESFLLFYPDTIFPAHSLARTSIYTLLGLGSLFTSVFCPAIFVALGGRFCNGWSRALRIAAKALTGILIFGGAFLLVVRDFSPESPVLPHLFVAAGVMLTIASWFGAGQMVRARAEFRPAALQSTSAPGRHCPSGGYGGIPLFIAAVCIPYFFIGLAMEVLMPVFTSVFLHTPTWREALQTPLGAANMIWVFMTFQIIPGLLHLRFLRTLPISATSLAAVMISLVVLPSLALGALTACVTGLALGTPAALAVLKTFAFMLAPCVFSLYFAVRQGLGMQAYAVIILTVVLFQTLPLWLKMFFHDAEPPLSVAEAVAAGSVLLAFLLTRSSLMRRSQTYRIQPTPFGNPTWGAGR